MPPTVELRGRPAAPGIAAGPLVVIGRPVAARQPTGDPARERAALEAAVAASVAAIQRLAASVEDEARDILDFQIAMLEDGALSEAAGDLIGDGVDAATAWSETIAAADRRLRIHRR